MSDLVGNPKDRFSRIMAHKSSDIGKPVDRVSILAFLKRPCLAKEDSYHREIIHK